MLDKNILLHNLLFGVLNWSLKLKEKNIMQRHSKNYEELDEAPKIQNYESNPV